MATKIFNGLDLQSQKIVSLADGTGPADAVTKAQLDNAVAGLAWKTPVRVATTTNGTLATAFANGQTVDGVALTTGMRILLKNQTTATENGIYTVNASGAPTRATDADSTAELQNATAYVIAGTVNADLAFTQTANDPTVGSTSLVWAQVGGGTAYTAGASGGLQLTGSAFSILLDSSPGLLLGAGGVKIDPAYSGLAKRYSVNVPNNTTAVITHSLGTLDVIVQVHEISGGAVVMPDIVVVDTNTVNLVYAVAPGAAAHRVTVLA